MTNTDKEKSGKINKEDVIKELIETGAEITGGLMGSILGVYLAGPTGLVIGGVGGPLLSKALRSIGTEMKQRLLGPREEIRIGAVYTFALAKIKENFENSKQIRTDDFFDKKGNNRSGAEEILEGIVITAQKEYQEKKVKYIGNLYANICITGLVSKEQANQFIKFCNILSYRQFILLQLLNENNGKGFSNESEERVKQFDINIELRELHQLGLIGFMVWQRDEPKYSIKKKTLKITESGAFFCQMLSLDEIPRNELETINILLI
jgi:hypothetical protein